MSETIFSIDPGPLVACDGCSADWTIREASGGIHVAGWSFCPDCAPEMIAKAKEANEEDQLLYCPMDMSFANWVRNVLR